ncbi:LysE family translocator [Psychromonas sp. 14N.309.X.WAT.B.A12]|uniref:LysE family translocator n=1 Tax=unclassified Psychromonas TaxID=2614957 RepID=UPI0025B16AF3|nr:LysE family translocator [Psychromonas sp. 14N.309.X.WAT.B.A12]MDN2662593.1 LysE family translocator [Psychromonas sp. 14N.309.X.WAT.B.A12]
MNEVFAFSLVALLLVVSPGPNGVLILKTIANQPKSAAMINLMGIACATFMHGGLSIFGLSALVMQSAELFMLIKLLGAAYLFYIGFKALYGSFKKAKQRPPQDGAFNTTAPDVRNSGFISCLNEGFFTQLLNPKVSMFYLAAFPQFIHFDQQDITAAFLLVGIHASLIICWFSLLIVLVDKIKGLRQSKGSWLNLWTERLSGAVMIYFSFLIVTQK